MPSSGFRVLSKVPRDAVAIIVGSIRLRLGSVTNRFFVCAVHEKRPNPVSLSPVALGIGSRRAGCLSGSVLRRSSALIETTAIVDR